MLESRKHRCGQFPRQSDLITSWLRSPAKHVSLTGWHVVTVAGSDLVMPSGPAPTGGIVKPILRRRCDLMDFLNQRIKDYCIGNISSRWFITGMNVCGASGRYPSAECGLIAL